MNFEFFIVKRIIQSDNNSPSFSASILKISVAAVAIGIAVMLIAIATGTGLQQKIKDKVIGFDGHIQITGFNANYSLESTSMVIGNLENELTQVECIKNTQIFAKKATILKTKTDFEGVVFKGVGDNYNWTFFNQYLIEGRPILLNDNFKNDSLIISKNTADKLNLSRGDKVFLYFVREAPAPSRTLPFYIQGIYHTGLENFDDIYILGDIKHIQNINNWEPDEVGGLEINLHNPNMLDKANDQINRLIGYNLVSSTSKSKNKQIFNWLALFDTNIFVILLIMIIVAIINMVSCILILILEKTRMIGILKSIGSRNWHIQKIFLYNAAYLIVKGLIWGNIIGLGICLIQKYTGLFKLDEASYYVSEIPIHLNLLHIVGINIITFSVCTLMMLIPSVIISKILPIRAIRFQ